MHIKISKKQFFKYESAVDALKDIANVLNEPSEIDEHGNAAYKADKPLQEIREILLLGGYMEYPKRYPIPGFKDMEQDGEIKIGFGGK